MADEEKGPYPAPFPKDSISAYQLLQVHKRRLLLRKEYLDYWQATKQTTSTGRPVDAILSPASCGASMPHGENSNT